MEMLLFRAWVDRSDAKEYVECHQFTQLHVGGVLGIIIISGIIQLNLPFRITCDWYRYVVIIVMNPYIEIKSNYNSVI